VSQPQRMFNIRARDLPKYAFNATAFVFITGLAVMAAHAAWVDRSSDLSGFVWASFAFFAVMCMAGAAHTIPYTIAQRSRGWFLFFIILLVAAFPWAFYFDFMAIAGIFDKAQAAVTQQYKTRTNREKTETELTEELRRLDDQLKAIPTLVDGGQARPVRPLKTIEADGRFLASQRCTQIDPKSAGQRTICQEHSFAVDRQQKESRRDGIKGEIIAQRDKLEVTSTVVSDDVAGTRRLSQVMGWSKETTSRWMPIVLTLLAELLAVLVPLAAGYVTHGGMHGSGSPAAATASGAPAPAQDHVTVYQVRDAEAEKLKRRIQEATANLRH
jgi:hypothetical protein